MKDKLEILYKDENTVVCIKPVGVSSQKSENDNMIDIIKNELFLSFDPFVINRLDTAVSGVMVYALNKKTASDLSRQTADKSFEKEYFAVVHSKPDERCGEFEDLLFKDSKKNKSFVVKRERKGVKKARLEYECICTDEINGSVLTLVRIKIYTGRTHQIRVQFSTRGMPLVGDGKYGAKDNCDIALFLKSVSYNVNGKHFSFSADLPDKFPFNSFNL